MSCENYEHLIALYVEDDLFAPDRRRVAAHLQLCSDCWDLAEDLKDSQAVFKSTRQDVPNAAALAALRRRVLSEAGVHESLSWFERFVFGGLRRKVAIAGLTVAVLSSTVLWITRSPQVGMKTSSPEVAMEPAPAVVVPMPVAEPEAQPHRERLPRPAPSAERTTQVAIKFVTDDPNIIIYWLVDEVVEKGE